MICNFFNLFSLWYYKILFLYLCTCYTYPIIIILLVLFWSLEFNLFIFTISLFYLSDFSNFRSYPVSRCLLIIYPITCFEIKPPIEIILCKSINWSYFKRFFLYISVECLSFTYKFYRETSIANSFNFSLTPYNSFTIMLRFESNN